MNLSVVSDARLRDRSSRFTGGGCGGVNNELYPADPFRGEAGFEGVVGQSRAIREVLQLVELVSATDATVLLLGETGSGKELIAHAIHNRSRRRNYAFVKLNCAAIPSGLLESELFGHERGAFTGAITQKIGRLELADQGSLFLDEIGDIPLELQPKLLRVLQEREFERLGSTRTKKVDVRVVAATHCDLEEVIEERQFRLDLYYRLNVFPISIPPLRERAEDIPLLVRHFVQQFAQQMGKTIDAISPETMQALTRYPWPGNIRELQNVMERAVIIYKEGNLLVKKSWLARASFQTQPAIQPPFRKTAAEDRKAIGAALAETGGRVSGPLGAAAKLGIPPSTLESKIRSMKINKYHFKTPLLKPSLFKNPAYAFTNFANSRRSCGSPTREPQPFEGHTNWRSHCTNEVEEGLGREDRPEGSKAMRDRMLVVVFDTETKANEGKEALHQLENEGSIALYAYAVVAKNADGTATVKQSDDPGPLGTLVGTSLGSFIGILGGPTGVAIGAVVGSVAGSAADLNNARVGDDFIDDVARELLPGRFAVAAEIQEESTTPVDTRMESLGGTVFRRALSDVANTVDDEAVAAMRADFAQMKAEHAQARADRKAKLAAKLNQLDSRIQARLERAKERRMAVKRQAQVKAEVLKAKAAALRAKAAETHV
jgi:DNA-binding NtrC family response regulator/uncharacterized membrane protein